MAFIEERMYGSFPQGPRLRRRQTGVTKLQHSDGLEVGQGRDLGAGGERLWSSASSSETGHS